MTLLVQTQKSIVVHCPTCGHYKSHHIGGLGCDVCRFMIEKGWQKGAICQEAFKLRISGRELEQARAVPKDTYNGRTKCATCFEIWWAHDGLVCPNMETLFVPLIGGCDA